MPRFVALKVVQAATAMKSSREIFETLKDISGSRWLSRDAVKSIICYMRMNRGRFSYSAWQRQLLDANHNVLNSMMARNDESFSLKEKHSNEVNKNATGEENNYVA